MTMLLPTAMCVLMSLQTLMHEFIPHKQMVLNIPHLLQLLADVQSLFFRYIQKGPGKGNSKQNDVCAENKAGQ